MTWVRAGSLGSADPERRDALLARVLSELLACQAVMLADGPVAAALLYAARGGRVRVGGDGGRVIWADDP